MWCTLDWRYRISSPSPCFARIVPRVFNHLFIRAFWDKWEPSDPVSRFVLLVHCGPTLLKMNSLYIHHSLGVRLSTWLRTSKRLASETALWSRCDLRRSEICQNPSTGTKHLPTEQLAIIVCQVDVIAFDCSCVHQMPLIITNIIVGTATIDNIRHDGYERDNAANSDRIFGEFLTNLPVLSYR